MVDSFIPIPEALRRYLEAHEALDRTVIVYNDRRAAVFAPLKDKGTAVIFPEGNGFKRELEPPGHELETYEITAYGRHLETITF